MSEPAIERVSAACPASKYKDDRHEWLTVMHEDSISLRCSPYAHWSYALKRCDQCKLVVLVLEHSGGTSYNEPPRKSDVVVHAFHERKP